MGMGTCSEAVRTWVQIPSIHMTVHAISHRWKVETGGDESLPVNQLVQKGEHVVQ